jgi:hypothetical protein
MWMWFLRAPRGIRLAILAVLCFLVLPAVAIPVLAWLLPPRPTEPLLPDAPCPAELKGAVRTPTQYTGKAPPYQGAGPHLMRMVEVLPEGNHDISFTLGWPQQWVADGDFYPARTQLVVCEYAIERGAILECKYGAYVIRPMRMNYVYRVYEARTAKFIKEFRIKTIGVCPYSITVRDGKVPHDMREGRDYTALEKALRPLVERPVKDG